MKPKENIPDVGVIVARFQVHNLSEAHRDLIYTVAQRHKKVIIFLGLSPLLGTRSNPLDFESRKQMVLEAFPDTTVLYIKDMPDDLAWSKRLDEQIADHLLPRQTVMLYGGRNSFIEHYVGRYPVTELESKTYLSGTELRRQISSRVKGTADFRAGVIWSTNNRWPSVQCTIDVIITDERDRLLLVRKHGETKFRFVGGFAQPDTDTFEIDANREIHEEAGVQCASPVYIGSRVIDDWRHRGEIDKIKSLIFEAKYLFGTPSPLDTQEIAEVRWFPVSELSANKSIIAPEHHSIFNLYLTRHPDIDKDTNQNETQDNISA